MVRPSRILLAPADIGSVGESGFTLHEKNGLEHSDGPARLSFVAFEG
jgi:hypothetical protein